MNYTTYGNTTSIHFFRESLTTSKWFWPKEPTTGPVRELNPGPLAPLVRIMSLDQQAGQCRNGIFIIDLLKTGGLIPVCHNFVMDGLVFLDRAAFRIIFQVWLSTCLTWGRILRHRRSQEPITWSLQLLYIFVMAFSQTSLFLVWIYRELGLPTRAHRPIKISTWLISNFLVNISKEKQQRDARLLAIVRVQIHMNKGVPRSHLDKKQTTDSCKRYMLCDSVLTYGETVDNLNML